MPAGDEQRLIGERPLALAASVTVVGHALEGVQEALEGEAPRFYANSPVDLTSMTYFEDSNFARGVVDAIEDAVVPDPNSPAILVFPTKPLDARRAGGSPKPQDGFIQALDNLGREGF